MLRRILSSTVLVCFFLTTLGPLPRAHADMLGLPVSGAMVNLSAAYEPVMIKGLTVHKDNPFLFDFLVDVGQDKMAGDPLKKEGEKLIKYFLASLAIPDTDVWVNLSPYEKNRMIPEALGQTDMGRDLLAQDYVLKQLTASLIYPEKQLGKKFWDKVYAKAQAMYGTTQVPVNTFNKVWIMADRAEVFEHNQTAFVVDQHLKVMLEEDYLALTKHEAPMPTRGHTQSKITMSLSSSTLPNDSAWNVKASQGNPQTHSVTSQIVKEIILPELEKEVNTGKNFANLRQIFNSIILSSWYKNNLKQALLNQVYANQSKVKGINVNDPTVKQQIYEQYLKAYKKGVFNYIKEDINAANGQTIPRKYFSGGMAEGAASAEKVITNRDVAMGAQQMANQHINGIVDFAMLANTQPKTMTDKEIKRRLTAVANKAKPLAGMPLSYVIISGEKIEKSDALIDIEQVLKSLLVANVDEKFIIVGKEKIGQVYPSIFTSIFDILDNQYKLDTMRNHGKYPVTIQFDPAGKIPNSKQSLGILRDRLIHQLDSVSTYIEKNVADHYIWKSDGTFDAAMTVQQPFIMVYDPVHGKLQSEVKADNGESVLISSEAKPSVTGFGAAGFDLKLNGVVLPTEKIRGDDYVGVSGPFLLIDRMSQSRTLANDIPTSIDIFYLVNGSHAVKLTPKEIEASLAFKVGAYVRDIESSIRFDEKGNAILGNDNIKIDVRKLRESHLDQTWLEAKKKEFGDGSDQDRAMTNERQVAKKLEAELESAYYRNHILTDEAMTVRRVAEVIQKNIGDREFVTNVLPRYVDMNIGYLQKGDLVNRIVQFLQVGYTPFLTDADYDKNDAPQKIMIFDPKGEILQWKREDFSKIQMYGGLILKFKNTYLILLQPVLNGDKAMNGGIDLNTSNGMQWKVSKDGLGVEMNVDSAMVQRIQREGIDWLEPEIIRMTPVVSVWPLVGLEEPKKDIQLAKV